MERTPAPSPADPSRSDPSCPDASRPDASRPDPSCPDPSSPPAASRAEAIRADLIGEFLRRMNEGDAAARDELVRCLYGELRRCARAHMARQDPSHTLTPTALVHEVFLKLLRPGAGPWNDTSHFLAVASRAMRHVLVDHARSKHLPEGVEVIHGEDLDQIACEFQQVYDIEELNHCLELLESREPALGVAIEAHYFGGRTLEEAAQIAGIPLKTLERHWKAFRAMLASRRRR